MQKGEYFNKFLIVLLPMDAMTKRDASDPNRSNGYSDLPNAALDDISDKVCSNLDKKFIYDITTKPGLSLVILSNSHHTSH